MRHLFADPKTDFVFKKLFGTEERRPLLAALLQGLLELDEAHRLVGVELLPPTQRPHVPELQRPLVDVQCMDARGLQYRVKMQVLNVEAFEKRLVSDVVNHGQLDTGQRYPGLNEVIGVTVSDFELWPRSHVPQVPMLSRWRMQEQPGRAWREGRLQFVFLELPKYDTSRPPRTVAEKWAYFFREAGKLKEVPEVLAEPPFMDALEAARLARFTVGEWDEYLRAGMAIQDMRGALSLARQEGWRQGRAVGAMQAAILKLLRQRGLPLSAQEEARLEDCEDLDTLERWFSQALTAATATEALQ
jgi:predicted transposase/invertase (TIGR01784 family)